MESTARDLLRREWYRLTEMDYTSDATRARECPVLPVLPELLELIQEAPDQPVYQLVSTIRQLLVEREFIDGNGDSVVGEDVQDTIDRQVGLIVGVLEQLRRDGIDQGHWSEFRAAPIMFG
jgi:hypothetical protein